ncbi:MAG: hypothetical protein EA422_06655 [Gemmatimonadales bacterium]|nr:MAG: hypothetical protein EA422_06655 [Gemmatimonadales bacterium]
MRSLFLFDDRVARSWHPFSTTRPVAELLFGALLLRERIERAVGLPARAILGCPELQGFSEPGAPPVFGARATYGPSGDESLILLSRWIPPLGSALPLPAAAPPTGLRLACEGTPVGWLLPAGRSLPSGDAFALGAGDTGGEPEVGAEMEIPGTVLPRPWTLMEQNPERIMEDLGTLYPQGHGADVAPLDPPAGVWLTGPHPVSAGAGVEVAPGVVLDSRDGPIHLSTGVRVEPRTHIQGPAWVGPGSHLLGGRLGSVSCGPVCKLHGEVDSSILNGFVNKAHDGHLGHAVVGRWVNLGAMTTNSDLKNTYGPIRVQTAPGPVPRDPVGVETGMIKVGAFLGDHVRTGIGTLLNGGVVVGAGSTLFAGPVVSGWVPPFSWVSAQGTQSVRLDAFLTVAARIMDRRGMELDEGVRELLTRLHGVSTGEGTGTSARGGRGGSRSAPKEGPFR